MDNRQQLLNKLSNDIKKMENEIEHKKRYNLRNSIVRALIKSGIAIDYALPFILATIMVSTGFKENAPFHIDEIREKAAIETIDTSNGIHLEHISYASSYNEEAIEHSTGWMINNQGLYERTVTSYRLDSSIDLNDTDKILSMSKEEIENLLVITNIQTIRKNTLTPEDMIYDSNCLIVINHTISDDVTVVREETIVENIVNSIGFIFLSLCWGYNIRLIGKIFVKTYLRDKLREYEPLYIQINNETIETMKNVLEIKKQNLAMINESTNNTEYLYRLRKV